MSYGVIVNTSVFGTEESRFEPLWDNTKYNWTETYSLENRVKEFSKWSIGEMAYHPILSRWSRRIVTVIDRKLRRVEESGLSRAVWGGQHVGSNPASPTNIEKSSNGRIPDFESGRCRFDPYLLNKKN